MVQSGEILFQTHCAACHRSNAQGQTNFPNLIDNHWLYGGTDEAILTSIKDGRNGVMPGWKGILTQEQIQDISYHITSLNGRNSDAPAVKLKIGESLFGQYCSSCHGDGKQGNPLIGAPNLSNSIWLHGGSWRDSNYNFVWIKQCNAVF